MADRIATAALALLQTKGSRGVSIRGVAHEVNITPMAIYRHFPDRETLLTRVADTRLAELAAEWRAEPRTGSPTELIMAALSSLLDLAFREPHVYDYLFLEPRASARRFPDGFAQGASPTFALLVELVESAMAAGELKRADALEVSLALSAVVHGFVAMDHGGRLNLSQSAIRGLCSRTLGGILDGLST
jgi:AcrR family transcriptional regulator